MASLNAYTFDNMARFGNDNTYQDQRNLQNTKYGNYLLSNFFEADGLMSSPIKFATSQPNVFYSGSHGAVTGLNIDESSILQKSEMTVQRERLDLQERPFLTVPYMGRGLGDPTLESQIVHGEQISSRKSLTNITEQTYNGYYPLLDSVQEKITNPNYLVEEAASSGWTRGGASSRDLSRA